MPTAFSALGPIVYDRIDVDRPSGAPAYSPALVLLHGAAVTRAVWEPQVAALRNRVTMIVPDLPGHGESVGLRHDLTMVAVAEAVCEVIDDAGLQRVALCGHSYGGMLAQYLAATHGDRVERLVLAETAVGLRTTPGERMASAATRGVLVAARLPMGVLAWLTARAYGRTAASRTLVQRDIAAMEGENFRRLWRLIDTYDGRENLSRVRCPTLVLLAGANRRTHRQGRLMAEAIPGARLQVLPGTGHLLNVDAPEAFNRALVAFLESRMR